MKNKPNLAQAQISVFVHSTEISTGIIQTEGHINIISQFRVCKDSSKRKSIKIISGRKLMPTSERGIPALHWIKRKPQHVLRVTLLFKVKKCRPTEDFYYFFIQIL